MSLSDRLAAAAKARDEQEPQAAARTRPAAMSTTITEVPGSRVEIIVAATRPVAAVEPDPTAAPDAVCPTCSRTGELGMVDMVGRTAEWACEVCGTMWRARLPAPADAE